MTANELKIFLDKYFEFTVDKSELVEENSKIYFVDEKCKENYNEFFILEKEILGIKNLKLNSKFLKRIINLKIGEKKISIFPVKSEENERKIIMLKGINEINCGKISERNRKTEFFTKEILVALYPNKKDKNYFVEEILNNILKEFREK